MELSALGAWLPLLDSEVRQPYFQTLCRRVDEAFQNGTVYPPQPSVFAAFWLTPPEQVRVVILGQDPYHEAGQANGLAFSVSDGTPFPPSLRNIFTELTQDLGCPMPDSGDLTPWARQGVFLLNTVLSVAQGQANSHKAWGWQRFTDAVIAATAALPQPVAFVLWGGQAQKKRPLLSSPHPRLVLTAPHPSPLSSYRGFFGSAPFSKVNDFLSAHGQAPIAWDAIGTRSRGSL